MTYKKFIEKYPDTVFGEVTATRDFDVPDRYEGTPFETWPVMDLGWRLQLEHHCEEWIIGDVGQAYDMIRNLQEAIRFCEENA